MGIGEMAFCIFRRFKSRGSGDRYKGRANRGKSIPYKVRRVVLHRDVGVVDRYGRLNERSHRVSADNWLQIFKFPICK